MRQEIERDAAAIAHAAAPYLLGAIAAAIEYLLKTVDVAHLSPPLAVFWPMLAAFVTAVVLPRLRARAK